MRPRERFFKVQALFDCKIRSCKSLMAIKKNILKQKVIRKAIFLSLFLTAFIFNDLKSQPSRTHPSAYSDFVFSQTTSKKDTVVYYRYVSDWWFGFLGGLNLNMYFGNLQIPRNPFKDPDLNNFLIDFPSGFGTGLYFGLKGDWLPKNEDWGASLQVVFVDYRNTETKSEIYPDLLSTHWILNANYHYITISPSARYNLPVTGLHLLGGLDFDILASSKQGMNQAFVNGAEIEYVAKLPSKAKPFRFGGHVGVGYDLLAADINKRIRAFFTPYLTLQAGTNVYSDFGSSRNTVLARLGLQVRFGVDELITDTLRFDPYYQEPPQFLASLSEELIIFKGFAHKPLIAGALSELKMKEWEPIGAAESIAEIPVAEEEIIAELPTSEEIVEEESDENLVVIQEGQGRERRIILKTNSKESFSFARSNTTQLTTAMRQYLDRIADYLKRNPSARVRVVGHSDDLGTVEENERRARERADNVVNYLLRNQIHRRRILDDSKGSRDAAVSGFTETARRANRRIEITIIQ